MSASFLFLPGILALISKKNIGYFFKMLPVVNIGYFYRLSKKVVDCRKAVGKCEAGFGALVTPEDEANLEIENGRSYNFSKGLNSYFTIFFQVK